jgi:hypothetical protein
MALQTDLNFGVISETSMNQAAVSGPLTWRITCVSIYHRLHYSK